MDMLRRLLASVTVGGGTQPTPSAGVLESLGQKLLSLLKPSSVVEVLLFRGTDLVFQQGYDPILDRVVADAEAAARQYSVANALRDLTQDSFLMQGNSLSYHYGNFWIVALTEGPYTLLAIAQNAFSPYLVEKWLQAFALKLPAETRA